MTYEGNMTGQGDIRLYLNNPSNYPITAIRVVALDLSYPTRKNFEENGDATKVERETIVGKTLVKAGKLKFDDINVGFIMRNISNVGEQRLNYKISWLTGSFICTITYGKLGGRFVIEDISYH